MAALLHIGQQPAPARGRAAAIGAWRALRRRVTARPPSPRGRASGTRPASPREVRSPAPPRAASPRPPSRGVDPGAGDGEAPGEIGEVRYLRADPHDPAMHLEIRDRARSPERNGASAVADRAGGRSPSSSASRSASKASAASGSTGAGSSAGAPASVSRMSAVGRGGTPRRSRRRLVLPPSSKIRPVQRLGEASGGGISSGRPLRPAVVDDPDLHRRAGAATAPDRAPRRSRC